MQPNQDKDNSTGIQQRRNGRIVNRPSQPHVAGPAEGFMSSPEGSDAGEKRDSFNRSNLQTSGMQPGEEFLKEQQADKKDISKELNKVAKKKPHLLMTLIVGGALLIAVAGIVLAFNLAS